MTSINLIRLHHRIHFFYQGGICSILHYFPSVDCNLIESWIWFCLLLPLSPVFLTHLRPFCFSCCSTFCNLLSSSFCLSFSASSLAAISCASCCFCLALSIASIRAL